MGILNHIMAAALALMVAALPVGAQDRLADMTMPDLLRELARPEAENWQVIERRIVREWSRTGSATLDLLFRRGRQALADEDPVAAAEHFTAVIERDPDFAEGWNARATAYFQAGLFGPAVADIREALARNPHHFGALTGLGLILEQTGDLEGALTALRAAAAIHPNQPGIEASLQRIERQVGGRTL